jgi:hypothetical protein
MAIAITMTAGTLQVGAVYNCQTFFNAMCSRMTATADGQEITIVPGTLPAGVVYNKQSYLEAISARMTAVFHGNVAVPTAVPITVVLTAKLPVGVAYKDPQAYYDAIVPLMSATVPAIPT